MTARSPSRFFTRRFFPPGYFALRVVCGGVLMIAASWLFGTIAVDVVSGAPLVVMDASVATWLHAHADANLTRIMLVLSQLHGLVAIIAYALVLAAVLAWNKNWYWLLALAVAVPGGMLLNALLKWAYQRVRPSFDDPLLTLSTYSFPSGHTAGTTLLYGFLAALLFSRIRAWPWRVAICMLGALMIAAVGFSRMYLGVHYLSDVIAAVAASTAWLALCLTSVDGLRRRRAHRRLLT